MKYDAAVVGAGPSGAWAAYCLARRGARVAIFDPSHPREKPCGGGVTGRALALVGNAIDRATLAATNICAARIRSCAASTAHDEAIVPLASSSLVVASRTAFDAALLDAAVGAGAVLRRSRVTAITTLADRTRIDTRDGSHDADWMIGADGTNSLVRRSVALPFRRDQLSIATGFFARGTTSREIVIEMTADPPGYIWSFPRADHLAIGICAQADGGASASALRARTLQWIRSTAIAGDAPLQEYSWPIPSLAARDFRRLTVAGPRWCLVGDAAGLVDPITREGIFFAIASGEWAADAIAGGGPPETVAHTYAARVHDEAAPELARAARLKTGFFRPAFGSLLVRALKQSEGIRTVMADLIAGEQSYRSLKWRLVRTMEVQLAWRAFRTRQWNV
jgi:geranylgeranyl reductase family protein